MGMCRDFLVVCGRRFWLFGVSCLGGDALRSRFVGRVETCPYNLAIPLCERVWFGVYHAMNR